MKLFKVRRSFKKEFRRQLRLALIAAIGFTVAFAWRNAIYNSTANLIEQLTESTRLVINEVLTALTITILAVIAIFITARMLKER